MEKSLQHRIYSEKCEARGTSTAVKIFPTARLTVTPADSHTTLYIAPRVLVDSFQGLGLGWCLELGFD